MINSLTTLYEDVHFRHNYSEIYQIISILPTTIPDGDAAPCIDLLEMNLSDLMNRIENTPPDNPEVVKRFKKLNDHILLEIGRSQELDRRFEKKLASIDQKMTDVKKDLTATKSKATKLKNQVNTNQKTYEEVENKITNLQGNIITIVGLLVSIVPLLSMNINFVAQNLSVRTIICCNGMMLLVIGAIFDMIYRFYSGNKCKWSPAIPVGILGLLLILFSVYSGHTNNEEMNLDAPLSDAFIATDEIKNP